MKAAVEKARSLGMNTYGHMDNNIVSIEEALDMGMKNFEHASTISDTVFEFSQHGDSLTKRLQEHYPAVQAYMPFALEKIQFVEENLQLRAKRDQLIQRMISSGASPLLSTCLVPFADGVITIPF